MWTYKKFALVDLFYIPVKSEIYSAKIDAIKAKEADEGLGLKCYEVYKKEER